jgi:hypothetical protein
MFAFELQRRSDAGEWGIASLAAHPGVSRTDLLHNGPGRNSLIGLVRSVFGFVSRWSMSPRDGLPGQARQ